ncbi:MAG: SCO2322 family protein [Terracoccus sp.]
MLTRPISPTRRTQVRGLLATLVALALAVLTIAPAQAAAYRYWGFYQLTDGAWAYAQKGPDQTTPKDGTVEGWRYAIGDESSSRLPRAVLTFDELCASTPAQDGKKRVGLVIDFGRSADSADNATPPEPTASCAVVAADGTSSDVLASAGQLRVEGGLVCAVAGYPATDCGGEVKEVSREAAAPDTAIQIAAPGAAATPTTSEASPSATATDGGATPTATESAPAVADPATTAADTSSGTSWAGYVIAALVLLALIAYLVLRSRRQQADR